MSANVRAWIGLVAGAALALTAAGACFSEKDGETPFDPATECNVPLDAIQNGNAIVAIRDFTFVPDSISIPAGRTVTWVNCEEVGVEPHTTTSDTGVWGSSDLFPGASYSFTFADPGVFIYHCVPHRPIMSGYKVVVE